MLTVLQKPLYEQMGGAAGIERLVDTFYGIIEQAKHPQSYVLLDLHAGGPGLDHARMQLRHFLSGLFGGPELYRETHGHLNIKRAHQRVAITPRAREAWLGCMSLALEEAGFEAPLKAILMARFGKIAHALENHPDEV